MNWRRKLAFLTGTALVTTGMLLAFAGPEASAAPVTGTAAAAPASGNGDNGTVKIHGSGTSTVDRRNEPHVCGFYLDAFGFDANQDVTWWIKSWPPTGDRTEVMHGTLTLDGTGNGRTGNMSLPNGHYKLYWTFNGEKGFAKQKVFWVSCKAPGSPPPPCMKNCKPGSPPPPCMKHCAPGSPPSTPSPSPSAAAFATSSPSAPSHGGLPITGWPLALIAGTGAALLATGGTAMVVARRRSGLRNR